MAIFQGFSNIGKVPELRRRIVFTLTIVAIYRIGVFITTPGVEKVADLPGSAVITGINGVSPAQANRRGVSHYRL